MYEQVCEKYGAKVEPLSAPQEMREEQAEGRNEVERNEQRRRRDEERQRAAAEQVWQEDRESAKCRCQQLLRRQAEGEKKQSEGQTQPPGGPTAAAG